MHGLKPKSPDHALKDVLDFCFEMVFVVF